MNDAVEIAKPLGQAESTYKQGALGSENLNHAASPPDALPDMSRQATSSKPRCLRNANVGSVPATSLQTKRRMGVFGDGFDRDTTDLFERFALDNRTRAAEKTRVPEVVSVLHDTVE